MKAAVVKEFAVPPQYGDFEEPVPAEGEVLLRVHAAALSNLVKGQASGQHYSRSNQLPLVPGNDGVGTTPDGQRVYFVGPRAPFGSMAERTVIAARRTLPLPAHIDDVTAAALGNPGLATWGALLGRAQLQPGERVLVNGATGVSGQQAVQVAKYLGASYVVATGRNPAVLEKLKSLGADETISLEQPDDVLAPALRSALRDREIHVVLDYVWGHPAELLLAAAAGQGGMGGEPRIRYVEVGAMAGREIAIKGEWLRSSGVELLGSGLGSLSGQQIVEALRTMYDAYGTASFQIETEAVPLREVASAWPRSESGRRIVFTI
jgi:NADPH:quinone reductase-like Zn-dependent oxidoreductase